MRSHLAYMNRTNAFSNATFHFEGLNPNPHTASGQMSCVLMVICFLHTRRNGTAALAMVSAAV